MYQMLEDELDLETRVIETINAIFHEKMTLMVFFIRLKKVLMVFFSLTSNFNS
jgi:hypothetical protein